MSSKMVYCKACGKEISVKAPMCPNCGAKNKKPILKRGWFWLIIIVAIFVALVNIDPSPKKEEDNSKALSEMYEILEDITAASDMDETVEDETEAEETTEATTKDNLINGMRPEFKEAMDSYETFFDDYCEFMEKYSKNPGDISMLKDYADFMSKYTEFMGKLEDWENEDMNDAELKYYTEVTLRIEKKLLDVAYAMN